MAQESKTPFQEIRSGLSAVRAAVTGTPPAAAPVPGAPAQAPSAVSILANGTAGNAAKFTPAFQGMADGFFTTADNTVVTVETNSTKYTNQYGTALGVSGDTVANALIASQTAAVNEFTENQIAYGNGRPVAKGGDGQDYGVDYNRLTVEKFAQESAANLLVVADTGSARLQAGTDSFASAMAAGTTAGVEISKVVAERQSELVGDIGFQAKFVTKEAGLNLAQTSPLEKAAYAGSDAFGASAVAGAEAFRQVAQELYYDFANAAGNEKVDRTKDQDTESALKSAQAEFEDIGGEFATDLQAAFSSGEDTGGPSFSQEPMGISVRALGQDSESNSAIPSGDRPAYSEAKSLQDYSDATFSPQLHLNAGDFYLSEEGPSAVAMSYMTGSQSGYQMPDVIVGNVSTLKTFNEGLETLYTTPAPIAGMSLSDRDFNPQDPQPTDLLPSGSSTPIGSNGSFDPAVLMNLAMERG